MDAAYSMYAKREYESLKAVLHVNYGAFTRIALLTCELLLTLYSPRSTSLKILKLELAGQ